MTFPYIEIEYHGRRIGMQGTAPYHVETPGSVVIICDRNGFNGIQFLDNPGAKFFGPNEAPEAVKHADAVCRALNEAAKLDGQP